MIRSLETADLNPNIRQGDTMVVVAFTCPCCKREVSVGRPLHRLPSTCIECPTKGCGKNDKRLLLSINAPAAGQPLTHLDLSFSLMSELVNENRNPDQAYLMAEGPSHARHMEHMAVMRRSNAMMASSCVTTGAVMRQLLEHFTGTIL